MPRSSVLLTAGALACAPSLAWAQERPTSVYFEPCDITQLNNAITAALTQPPFLLLTRNIPGALVVAIPDRVTVEHLQVSGTVWTFTVAFSRNGDSLGQSVESCNERQISDCTNQLVSDVKTAAGMGP